MNISEKKGGVLLSYIQMVSNVLLKFIYTPFLLHALGQNEYGLYSLVMSIVGYLSILDLGFGGTVTRYTIKYKEAGDKEGLYKLYSTLSVFYILIGLVALAICIVLSICTQSLFGDTMTTTEVSKLRIMILLVGFNLLFSFPLQISTSVVVAYEKFIFKNGLYLLRTFLQPIVMVLLLYLVNMKSVGAIVVVTLFNLGTYLWYYIYSIRKLDFKFSFSKFDKQLVKPLLSFSVWMFLAMVFEQLQYNSGQFILGLFQGTDVIAVWGIAMIFILNYRAISTAISNVYMPSLVTLSFNDDVVNIRKTVNTMVRLQSAVLMFILVNFILFGKQFILLWAGEEYVDAYICSVIVMIPMTISSSLEFCYLLQMAQNKMLYRTITTFGALLIVFFYIYITIDITLISFAYFMAGSIVLGLVLLVFIYIPRLRISPFAVIKNLFRVCCPPVALLLLFAILMNWMNFFDKGIVGLIIGMLVFNVFLIIEMWFLSFTKEDRISFLNRKN